MIQWLKKRLAGTLGSKKDFVKKLPIIKQINDKANIDLDSSRNNLLKENFYKILRDIYLEKDNYFDIWLDFGSLLGMYRNNGFVPTDFDMDFGVRYDQLDDFYKFMKILEDKGYKKTREFLYDNIPVEYSYNYQGLNIDFVIYRNSNDYIETETIAYLQSLKGNITNVEVYRFKIPFSELENYSYKDIVINIPKNPEKYLEAIYGKDFNIPVLNYNWRANPIYSKISNDYAEVILI